MFISHLSPKEVGICLRVLERLTILNLYITLLAVCVRTPLKSIIYYFLLAVKPALRWFKLILYTKRFL